jgi:hypothetical protein
MGVVRAGETLRSPGGRSGQKVVDLGGGPALRLEEFPEEGTGLLLAGLAVAEVVLDGGHELDDAVLNSRAELLGTMVVLVVVAMVVVAMFVVAMVVVVVVLGFRRGHDARLASGRNEGKAQLRPRCQTPLDVVRLDLEGAEQPDGSAAAAARPADHHKGAARPELGDTRSKLAGGDVAGALDVAGIPLAGPPDVDDVELRAAVECGLGLHPVRIRGFTF